MAQRARRQIADPTSSEPLHLAGSTWYQRTKCQYRTLPRHEPMVVCVSTGHHQGRTPMVALYILQPQALPYLFPTGEGTFP
eukprot:3933840-Rhodomonas_salina.1